MDEAKKIELKEAYKAMLSKDLKQMLAVDKEEYEEGVYELVVEAAKERGLTKLESGKLIPVDGIDEKISAMASTGKRFCNYFLDLLGIYCLSYPFWYIAGVILSLLGMEDVINMLVEFEENGGNFLLGIPLFIFYYYIFESIFKKTPAKFITRTKILNLNGSKPTKGKIFIRSLCRIIPFEPISGFGSVHDVWYGWHDNLSGTMVVDTNYPEKIDESITRRKEVTVKQRKTKKWDRGDRGKSSIP